MLPGAPPQRTITLVSTIVFGVALAALLVIALFPIFPQRFTVREGDTASRTVRAPRSVAFESDFLTDQRRAEAANAVPPSLVYDPAVRTRQLAEYDRIAARVSQIRALPDDARKRDALASLQLSPRSIETTINLPADRWQAVASEGRRVLNESLGVSLDDAAVTQAKDGVNSLVSVDFVADEALLTSEVVRPLIVTTLTTDDARTEDARAAARAAVPPERVSVNNGDVILSAGSRVDQVAIEKLRATGLLSRSIEWRNVVAVAIICAAAAAAVAGFLFVTQPGGVNSERHLISLALVIALPLLAAKFYVPLVIPDEDRYFLAFILPLAAAPILVAALLDTQVAVVVAAVIGVLVALVSAILPDISLVASVTPIDTFRLMLVYSLGPMIGAFIVHRADRLNLFLTGGAAVALVSFLMLLATWLIDSGREPEDVAWMALTTSIGGVSAGVLAAGAFVTVGFLFGVTTRVQLMELSQLNAPLMRRLQDDAPGTFHHSVIVGNLAERAADLVGADALLTRVGCYYHDIGKVLQPGLYIENQTGESPHEEMSPEASARAIRQHVSGGMELARRARIPTRVRAFIPEHHGTRLVAYFYRKAAEDDPDIDPARFQYPGPRPQSKETAIVMLADSTEAVVRSSPDRSPPRIDALVEEVIAERVAEGQMDECDLTLRDLRTVADSFKQTMRAVYHPRVQYPEPTEAETRRRVLRLPLISGANGGGSPSRAARRRSPR